MQVTPNQPPPQDDEPKLTLLDAYMLKLSAKAITLDGVLQIIGDDNRAEQQTKHDSLPEDEARKFRLHNMPCVFFAGQLDETDTKRIVDFSGYFCVPIRAGQDRVAELRPAIKASSFVRSCFSSASRNGLNVVLQMECTPTSEEEYRSYYDAGVSLLRSEYSLTEDELSATNSNPAIPCFLSYDPNVYSDTFPPETTTDTEEPPITHFVDEQPSEQPAPQTTHSSTLDDIKAERQRAEQETEQQTETGQERTDQPFTSSTARILRAMLAAVQPVDFQKALNMTDPNAKLKQSDIIVVVANEVRQLAERKNWAIALREGFVHLYNGQFWQVIDEDEVKHFLALAGEKMGVRGADTQYYEFKEKLHKQLLSSSFLPISDEDQNQVLINLANGTFEVRQEGGRLRGFHKSDFLRYQLPFSYDPSAKCPRFMAYLDRVLPEKALQNILSEFLGYVFLREPKLEKCLVLYGAGANGKSVFYEVSTALLGPENVLTFGLAHFKHEYNRAVLSGKLLNYGSELNAGLDSDLFKQLASVEPMQARLPYKSPFMIRNYAKMAFNANELPREVEHTEAFFRRLLIIPFTVTIPETERNPDLAHHIIQHELAGVFNWVLTGLNRLLKNRAFTNSPSVRDAVEQYRKESDTVALFLDENGYAPSANSCLFLKEFYAQYRAFCNENGNRALSQQNFSSRLQRHLGYNVTRRNTGNVVYAALTDRAT